LIVLKCINSIIKFLFQLKPPLLISDSTFQSNRPPADERIETFQLNSFYVRGTAHAFYKGKHYFFGGEDARLEEKRYNDFVFKLYRNKVVKTSIALPGNFSRAAAAIYNNEVWLCGSGGNPDQCFAFGGISVKVKSKRMRFGHTDGAGM
jgi:hypothetical protein